MMMYLIFLLARICMVMIFLTYMYILHDFVNQAAKNGSEETMRRVQEWNAENGNLSAQFTELSDTLDDTTKRLEDLQVVL